MTPDSLVVRKISEVPYNEFFLTFDDGPDPIGTPLVLDLLSKHEVKASFFVIGIFAEKNKKIFERILNEGHGVFCHSIDHNYRHYFRSKKHVKEWISNSLKQIEELTGVQSNIFRPPAGIITPPLLAAASELNVKLLLWSQRFYDKTNPLTLKKCQKKLGSLQKGDIVLLHDAQKQKNLDIFLKNLEWLIVELSLKGFKLSKLNNNGEFK